MNKKEQVRFVGTTKSLTQVQHKTLSLYSIKTHSIFFRCCYIFLKGTWLLELLTLPHTWFWSDSPRASLAGKTHLLICQPPHQLATPTWTPTELSMTQPVCDGVSVVTCSMTQPCGSTMDQYGPINVCLPLLSAVMESLVATEYKNGQYDVQLLLHRIDRR